MMNFRIFVCLVLAMPLFARAHEPECKKPDIAQDQLTNLLELERKKYSTLPPKPHNPSFSARRNGCHYIYKESGDAGKSTFFIFDDNGRLVDYILNRKTSTQNCHIGKMEYTLDQLSELISKARVANKSLPPGNKKLTKKVELHSCMYAYKENDDTQTVNEFFVDYYGAIYSVWNNKSGTVIPVKKFK